MIKYYLRKKISGVRLGPLTLQEVHEGVAGGTFKLDDQYSIDGQAWHPVGSMKGLRKSGRVPAAGDSIPASADEAGEEDLLEESRPERRVSTGYAYWEKRPVENQVIKKSAWSATWRDWVLLLVFIPAAWVIYWYVFESGEMDRIPQQEEEQRRSQPGARQMMQARAQQVEQAAQPGAAQPATAVAAVNAQPAPAAQAQAGDAPVAAQAPEPAEPVPAQPEAPLEKLDPATINNVMPHGATRLAWAAREGQLEEVRRLVEHGADPDLAIGLAQQAPLLWALQCKHEEVALYLVEKGVRLDCRNAEQMTPLLLACALNLQRVAEVLVKSGADANALSAKGDTPLDWTVHHGNTMLEELLRRKGGRSFKDLMRMIRYGAVDKVREIVDEVPGFASMVGAEGETVLHYAVTCTEKERILPLVEYLVGKGADVNVANADGMTPLLLAASAGEWQAFSHLVERKADVNKGSIDGVPLLLHLLEEQGGADAAGLKLVLGAGARLDVTNANGEAAIHVALRNSDQKALEVLLEAGADVQLPDGKGRRPLQLARIYNLAGCVQLLERRGAEAE